MYTFFGKACIVWLDRDAMICQGRARIRYVEVFKIKNAKDVHNAILQLRNTPRSLVFFSTGIHNDFNAGMLQRKVLLPLVHKMKSERLRRPQIVWATTHSFGLMKTPAFSSQTSETAMKYNDQMDALMRFNRLPVFDTFNLTKGLVSYDGVHYGLGANRVKVRIFLNYLLELYLKHKW
nr:hypothetical protein BaRGS_023562 [Batillaria attramentaria]